MLAVSTLNTSTGVLTSVGALGVSGGLAGLTFTSVPEGGATLAMLGLSMAGLMISYHRKRAAR